jgi:mRNA-degrading endonuclease RelE of RelBE toxin-antitoxin system
LAKHLVFIEVKAQKQLKKVPKRDQERIVEVLNTSAKEGLSARFDIKNLRGYQRHFRIRLGDYSPRRIFLLSLFSAFNCCFSVCYSELSRIRLAHLSICGESKDAPLS